MLQVEDSGPGIAPAEREAVFRPFYRAARHAVDGSGLGLAIVAEVAQRHGAEVSVGDARERDHAGGDRRRAVHGALPAAPARAAAGIAVAVHVRRRSPEGRAARRGRRRNGTSATGRAAATQLWFSRRFLATDIRMPSPSPSETIAVPP